MPDEALTQALSRALLVLRITLGLFLLQWGVEKFVVPQNTVAIWGYFYGLNVPQALAYLFGAAEIAIAACLFLGTVPDRRVRRGAGAARGQRARVLAPDAGPLGRPREPSVHRRRTGAGRPDRPVPAAPLGPRPPGAASGPAIRLIVSQAGCAMQCEAREALDQRLEQGVIAPRGEGAGHWRKAAYLSSSGRIASRPSEGRPIRARSTPAARHCSR